MGRAARHTCGVESTGLRERKKEQTRQALITASLKLFRKNGFTTTSVDDIVAACDVSPRTFYRYFPTKEDVLYADADRRTALLLSVLAGRPPDETPLVALRRSMMALIPDYEADRTVMERRQRIIKSSPSLRTDSLERQHAWEDALVRQLTARRAGLAESPLELRLASAAAAVALRTATVAWLEPGNTHDLATLLEYTFDRLATGLEHPPRRGIG